MKELIKNIKYSRSAFSYLEHILSLSVKSEQNGVVYYRIGSRNMFEIYNTGLNSVFTNRLNVCTDICHELKYKYCFSNKEKRSIMVGDFFKMKLNEEFDYIDVGIMME